MTPSQARRQRLLARQAGMPSPLGTATIPPETMAAAVEALAVNGRQSCSVCGSPEVTTVGIFEGDPQTQKLIGAPVGKVRLAVYVLCEACRTRPGAREQLEDAMLRPHEERREMAARN